MTFNVEFLNSDEFLKNDDKGVDLIKFFVYFCVGAFLYLDEGPDVPGI